MVLGSLFAGGRTIDADRHLLALHAPEGLDLDAYRSPAPEPEPVGV
jgi:hypothetical protein